MIEQITFGIITGISYSIIGWKKTHLQRGKPYNPIKLDNVKMIKSTLICGIVGAFAGYYNKDFNILLTSSLGISVTNLVNMFWKLNKKKIYELGSKIFRK